MGRVGCLGVGVGVGLVQETPVTLLWVLVYLANHMDRRERHAEALALIDEALAYTPTVIDLRLTRARILKHAGSLEAAADECETARKMDLADRSRPRPPPPPAQPVGAPPLPRSVCHGQRCSRWEREGSW